MKELNLEKMEKTHGGKFWGGGDWSCKNTSIGTYCCQTRYAFWFDLGRECEWL